MSDAQSGRGDFARADQRQQFGDVCLGIRTQPESRRFERRVGTHDQSARATAIPASAPPRHSRLFAKILASINPHWPCSKNDMVSNA